MPVSDELNYLVLAGYCRGVCTEEICVKKQQLLGAECVLCAFQRWTKHRAYSRREVKAV